MKSEEAFQPIICIYVNPPFWWVPTSTLWLYTSALKTFWSKGSVNNFRMTLNLDCLDPTQYELLSFTNQVVVGSQQRCRWGLKKVSDTNNSLNLTILNKFQKDGWHFMEIHTCRLVVSPDGENENNPPAGLMALLLIAKFKPAKIKIGNVPWSLPRNELTVHNDTFSSSLKMCDQIITTLFHSIYLPGRASKSCTSKKAWCYLVIYLRTLAPSTQHVCWIIN